MALPRFIRFLSAVTLGILLYLIYIVVYSVPESGARQLNPYETGWQEPNLDLIDEPPGQLNRVNGDNYSPSNPTSDRINATLLALVRNSELDQMLASMHDLERTFNRKFNYPWTFFNDEPFDNKFKAAILQATSAKVRFEQIPREHWEPPSWVDPQVYSDSVRLMKQEGVQYAEKRSYHQMCRWNSGMFAQHPALQHVEYYWRVEPNVHFFCDIDYDVFRFMRDRNKTYGFTIALYDSPASIPSLWPETLKFLADPRNARHLHPNNAWRWLTDAEHRPPHNLAANGYSTCHFWSNFEIARLDFWRSEAFRAYFSHLDRTSGFFYERWGDAPVHSIALGLFEDRDRIHWFRDIGYQHIPFFNCPKSPWGKCRGCKEGLLTDGEPFLYREDCRRSWFEHAGLGVWEE